MSDKMKLPQSDLLLLESEMAQRLLASTVPARFVGIANAESTRTRPIYPYLTVARDDGSGSPDKASNFDPSPQRRCQSQ
jgi:hypothetical protein